MGSIAAAAGNMFPLQANASCCIVVCRYVQQQLSNAAGEPLTQQEQAQLDFAGQLRNSSCHKARLLHYFPTNGGDQQQQQQQQQVAAGEDWCGWHLDHGALTGMDGT
jgi:hypothetical protein